MKDPQRLLCIALEQDTTKKRQMNDMQLKFKAGNNKEYEVNGIRNNAVYAKKSTTSQLSELYYLVLWKGYPDKENTWELVLAIQHLWRLVTDYHKDNPMKLTATSFPVDTAQPMAKHMQGQPAGPTVAPTKKRGQLARSTTTTKRAKKS